MDVSDNQKFCLKWNNFQNNFMAQFEALKEDEDFVDVTLSCYGQSVKAHKVVLSACSPYLKNIFKEHPCKHPVIILDNLSFKNLEAVIQFVYTGQVYVEQTDLSSFLKAAESLQIRGLSDPSARTNLMEPIIPAQSLETEHMQVSKKRESEDENEMKKPYSKRISRRFSIKDTIESNSKDKERDKEKEKEKEKDKEKDKDKDKDKDKEKEKEKEKEKDCKSNINNKSEAKSENSSLRLLAEMECSFETDERSVMLAGRTDDLSTGEHKKPHWLDPRSCPLCNRVYSNLSNLRQHMKLIHNPTLVTCKLCYKTFKTDLYLRRHLISFHEINANGSNMVSIEPFKPVQVLQQPATWNPPIKMEPEVNFTDIFSGTEIYQVPQ